MTLEEIIRQTRKLASDPEDKLYGDLDSSIPVVLCARGRNVAGATDKTERCEMVKVLKSI